MVEVPLQHHGEQVGELGVAVTEQPSADDRTLLSGSPVPPGWRWPTCG